MRCGNSIVALTKYIRIRCHRQKVIPFEIIYRINIQTVPFRRSFVLIWPYLELYREMKDRLFNCWLMWISEQYAMSTLNEKLFIFKLTAFIDVMVLCCIWIIPTIVDIFCFFLFCLYLKGMRMGMLIFPFYYSNFPW